MRSFFLFGLRGPIALALLVVSFTGVGAAAEPSAETAIRAAIDAYVQAFNQGDAEAFAAAWSPTGEMITDDGIHLKGREAILAAAKAKFAAGQKSKLRVIDPVVRFPAADMAIEEGAAVVTAADGSTSESTYTAVHVRRDGKWLLENVRETAVAPAVGDARPLDALAWMVGQWVDESDTATVETKVEWTMNRRFLICHFQVTVPGAEPLIGAQLIGFDPGRGEIRSWLFDADGTIGDGAWTHDGKQWIVKSQQTLVDGTHASSTNIYLPRDSNSYSWKSIGRKVGNQFLPNIEEIVVVRKGSKSSTGATKETTEVKP